MGIMSPDERDRLAGVPVGDLSDLAPRCPECLEALDEYSDVETCPYCGAVLAEDDE